MWLERIGAYAANLALRNWGWLMLLQGKGWAHPFMEIPIRRGLQFGRVDVAATNEEFSESVAVEVKIAYRQGDVEGQLLDAAKSSDYCFVAAPRPIWKQMVLPPSVGILEATPWPPRRSQALQLEVTEVRTAAQSSPEKGSRREFLHSMMSAASKRGRLPPQRDGRETCPACQSESCRFWNLRPSEFGSLVHD